MLKLRYVNESGDSIHFGDEAPVKVENGQPYFVRQNETNFYFLSQTGMSGPEAELLAAKSPGQRGRTPTGVNMDERVITVEACLVTSGAREEEGLRRKLLSVISPLKGGTLEIYGDHFAKQFSGVQVLVGPEFKDQDYTAPDGILYFGFTLAVPGNFVEDLQALTFDLVEVTPCFQFTLEFDQTIIFGDMTQGRAVFDNDGDAPAPIIAEIPGPVLTPMVTNETTGEFIRVHTPILAGETMFINTAFGKKTVVIRDENGGERSAFHYIDLDSVFFQLPVGRSSLRFKAEEGNDKARVKVRCKRLYLGV